MLISKQPMINVLNGIKTKRVPIWLMRQAGRYLEEYQQIRKNAGSFLDICYSPDLAKKVTLQPIHRFNFDAAIIFSDILVIPDALGQPVDFKPGVGPVLEPIRGVNSLAHLKLDRLKTHLAPVYEAVSSVRSELAENKSLIGFSGAPWTIATYMVEGGTSRDFTNTKLWACAAPDEFNNLIEILVSAITEHLISQIKGGADILQIFDSWAGLLSERAFERWCLAPIRKIVRGVLKEFPEIPIIIFPRLAGRRYLDVVEIEGISAVSLDHTLSLGWVHEHLQSKVIVQGNLDPIYLLAGGKAMREEVNRILDCLAPSPFIFNLGHGVLPNTPTEHVSELCDIITRFQRESS